MRTFYIAYCITVYVGYIIFVAVELLKGHTNALAFAFFFLTIWPLLTMFVGYEGLIHVKSEYIKKTNSGSIPMNWNKAIRDGAMAGVIVIISGMLCIWSSINSIWLFAIPIIAALIAPGIMGSISINRNQ